MKVWIINWEDPSDCWEWLRRLLVIEDYSLIAASSLIAAMNDNNASQQNIVHLIKDEACKTSLLRFVYSVICTWCCCCLYIHTWGLVNKLPNRKWLFEYLTNHVWKDDLVCNKLYALDRTNCVDYDFESTKDLGLTHPIAIFHLIG